MRRLLKVCSPMLVTWMLAACGSLPPQAFDHSARATVKRIELAPLGTPEHTEVRIMNPIGAGFGLVGNFVESRRAAGASQEMEKTLAAARFDFRSSLASSIARAIAKTGFILSRDAGERPDHEHARFLSKYPPAKKIDAYLDVYATYVGFEATQSSTAYKPRLELAARLVRVKDNLILFQDRIVYGDAADVDEDAVFVKADESLSFRSRASLQADPTRTARALQSAIDATAWELAKQFM
jgi:hypothetical protein